jgi:tetratricopeptide (TPR) repeat protein
MFGKLFTVIVPFGSIAWRVNLASAFVGASTSAVLGLFLLRITRNRVASFAAALTFAFSSEFWGQCVVAEVYPLNAFFLILCMLILVLWEQSGRTRYLYWFGLAYGFGMCCHHTMYFMGPMYGLFILCVDRRPWLRWRTYLKLSGIAVGVWVLAHLYLPFRAMTNPPINWGNPSSWEAFWDVVLRQQYSFGFQKNAVTVSRFAGQVGVFLKYHLEQFTPWLAALPLFGLYPLWKRGRLYLALVLGTFIYTAVGFILILNFDLDKESIWVNSTFFIPAHMMSAVMVGAAIDWVLSLRLKRAAFAVPGIMLSLAAVGVPLATNYRDCDMSKYYFAYDFAMNTLKTLDEKALYFPVADHATFPVLYLQAVEGMRPDVTIGNKYGYSEETLFKDMPFELRGRYGKIPSEREQAQIEDWLIAHTGRPAFFTRKRPLEGVPGARMENAGILYKVVTAGQPRSERNYWDEYVWHTLNKDDARGDFTAEVVLSDYQFFRGRYLLESGKIDEGLDAFKQALDVAGESKETLNNLGSACAEYNQLPAAKDYFAKALAIDSDYALSLINFAKVSMQENNFGDAAPALKRIIQNTPDDLEARWLFTRCSKELKRFDDALMQLEEIAKLTPNDPAAYKEMGLIYMQEKKDPRRAHEMLTHSLKLDPNQPDLLSYMMNPEQKAQSNDQLGPEPNDLIPKPPQPAIPSMPQSPDAQAPMPAFPQSPGQPTAPAFPQSPGQSTAPAFPQSPVSQAPMPPTPEPPGDPGL